MIDNEPVPMSQSDINYEEGDATPRPGTKPLLVTQPLGPSYSIDKGEVVWQNWHFRFRLDPRVGPVINLVRYQDGDRLRSVMYEGSLSEMYVPYMDTDEGWDSRAFVDAGEFLLGGLIKPVGPDDCPAQCAVLYRPGAFGRGRPGAQAATGMPVRTHAATVRRGGTSKVR